MYLILLLNDIHGRPADSF